MLFECGLCAVATAIAGLEQGVLYVGKCVAQKGGIGWYETNEMVFSMFILEK